MAIRTKHEITDATWFINKSGTMINSRLKLFIVIIISVPVLFSCSSMYQNRLNHRKIAMIKDTITGAFERFDIDNFDRNIERLIKAGYVIRHDNSSAFIKETLTYDGSTSIIRRFDQYNNLTQEIRHNSESTFEEIYIGDLIVYSRSYYKNLNIRSKGIGSWLGFSIGKQYFFNQQGDLINTKDNDEGYRFDYDQLFSFCRSHKISLKKPSTTPFVTIRKSLRRESGQHVWTIENPILEKGEYEFFVLDGSTGEILRKDHYPLYND